MLGAGRRRPGRARGTHRDREEGLEPEGGAEGRECCSSLWPRLIRLGWGVGRT